MTIIDRVLETAGYQRKKEEEEKHYDDASTKVYGLQLEEDGESPSTPLTLASPTPVDGENPLGKKIAFNTPSGVTLKRVPREHLEMIYFRDDITYNGINLLTRLMCSSIFKLVAVSDDEKARKEDQAYLDLWSYMTDLHGVTYETIKAIFMFGIGWQEQIWSDIKDVDGKKRKILARLDSIDCKYMDFFRDGYGNIKYNQYGFPEGYAQIVPPGHVVPEGRAITGMIYLVTQLGTGRAMKLFEDEIAYFTFETLGTGGDGVGVIEPQYDLVRRKKSIEKGHAQSVMRRGNTRYHIKNGNEKYRPGPDERESIKEELKKLKPEDDIVTEWFTDIKVLEAQDAGEVNETLLYYVSQQAACMGLPVPYLTGRGEDTNRSTLADQKVLLFKTIDSLKEKYIRQFERQVIPYLKKNREFKSEIKVVWEPLSLDDKAERSLRLQRYIKAGAITPTLDVENAIRELEGLPKLDKRPLPPQSVTKTNSPLPNTKEEEYPGPEQKK